MLFNNNNSKADDTQQTINNSAKTLLANIRFMSVDNPIRTVTITSAIPNEGKTFVAANLARAMATAGIRTLLVEADMRRRSMASTLNIHAQHGLYAVMSGEVDLSDAAVPTGIKYLHFLDAEPHIPNPSDLINSRRFNALIERAKKEYGYIVFDTPPVGTFVDAAVLGAKTDAVFMVVREQYTRKAEIARAAEQLKTANVSLSGLIMNFCERESSGYYYEYYYRDNQPKKRTEGEFASSSTHEFELDAIAEAQQEQQQQQQRQRINIEQQPSTPRNWSNAPDLGDDTGVLDSAGGREETPTTGAVGHGYASRSTIPPLGQTGVIDRNKLNNSAHMSGGNPGARR